MKPYLQFPIKYFFFGLILSQLFFLPWMAKANADDHHHDREKYEYKYDTEHEHEDDEHEQEEKNFSNEHNGEDKGNEVTGIFTAFILASANITVLLSILIRAARRSTRTSDSRRRQLKKFNKIQKKYLLPLHYVLNPVALIFGLAHFYLSYCGSSSLPELGLGGMIILMIMGLSIKIKILPKKIQKSAYLFHANPLPLCIILTVIFIGHGIID